MPKPLVYLVVILPLLVAGGVAAPSLAVTAYAAYHGVTIPAVPRANGLLIALPTSFLWIPVALLIANVILNSVRPLRRIAETYAATNKRPGYRESQRQIWKVLGLTACVCVPLIAVGWVV